jgi:hypothetical protein
MEFKGIIAVTFPRNFNKFDPGIREFAQRYGLPWKLIKAQVWQESAFEPDAVSPCGAVGLLQLMPDTDYMLDKDYDGKNPRGNLENGIRYDRWLFDRLWEFPEEGERLKFMLAAYNGGLGYINAAMELAYDCEFKEPMPKGHKGARPGQWQTWQTTSAFLCSPYCRLKGKKPDYRQMLDYVERIWEKFNYLLSNEKGGTMT